MFFRAHYSDDVVSVQPGDDAIEPTNSGSGTNGFFRISISRDSDLTVYSRLSGTAITGVAHTPNPGFVTAPGTPGSADVITHPTKDDLIESEEPVTLTILQTN